MTNVEIFEETQEVNHSGSYWKDGREIGVGFLPRQLKEVTYISAEQAAEFCKEPVKADENTACVICVKNMDSYSAAREMAEMNQEKILVLNFANSVHPGGGVRFGARAQEEDLCRKSTLYASLTSLHAKPYYEKHREVRNPLASDAMLLSPNVAIFRDQDNSFLGIPVHVAVLTCAAPVAYEHRNISDADYTQLLYHRIQAMLHTAAHFGYRILVLGAWGCGAFGNDAKLVAELFAKVLNEMPGAFRNVTFAVLSRDPEGYNLRSFQQVFD